MRTFMFFVAAVLISSQAITAQAADQPLVLPLYPGAVPGEGAKIAAESIKGDQGKRQISNVSQPNITVFLPPKEKNTGMPSSSPREAATAFWRSITKVTTSPNGSTRSVLPASSSNIACPSGQNIRTGR